MTLLTIQLVVSMIHSTIAPIDDSLIPRPTAYALNVRDLFPD